MNVTKERVQKLYTKFDENYVHTAKEIGCSHTHVYRIIKGKQSDDYSVKFINMVSKAYKKHFPVTKEEEIDEIKEALTYLKPEQFDIVKSMVKEFSPEYGSN